MDRELPAAPADQLGPVDPARGRRVHRRGRADRVHDRPRHRGADRRRRARARAHHPAGDGHDRCPGARDARPRRRGRVERPRGAQGRRRRVHHPQRAPVGPRPVGTAGIRQAPRLARDRRPQALPPRRGGLDQGVAPGRRSGRARRPRGPRGPGHRRLHGHRRPQQRAREGHDHDRGARRVRLPVHAAQDAEPRPRLDRARGQDRAGAREPPHPPAPRRGVPSPRVRGQRAADPGAVPGRRGRRRDRQRQVLHRGRADRRGRPLERDREPEQLHPAEPRGLQLRHVDAVVGWSPRRRRRARRRRRRAPSWRTARDELAARGQDRRRGPAHPPP